VGGEHTIDFLVHAKHRLEVVVVEEKNGGVLSSVNRATAKIKIA